MYAETYVKFTYIYTLYCVIPSEVFLLGAVVLWASPAAPIID